MKWTRKNLYSQYGEWSADYLLTLQAQAAKSSFRPTYHIAPTSGLLNDPNGFSFFNNQWHLFYQSFPFGPVHGLKSWVHLVSDDLVDWRNLGTALTADTVHDSHGVYSGSATVIDEQLFLMYTGNVRDKNWVRHPFQNGAYLTTDNQLTKLAHPLIEQPKHVTDHFRDPQILKKDDTYFTLLGAQDAATKRGKISIFKSKNLTTWEDLGYLNFTQQDMGYMIECPNLVAIDGKPVLIFCPQGLNKNIINYNNIYPNTYLVGDTCQLEKGKFNSSHRLELLDHGFDIYASQAFNTPDGNAYLVSWLGLPEIDYPTDSENWAHCMSVVKKLTIRDDKLYQEPVAAIKNYREEHAVLHGSLDSRQRKVIVEKATLSYELELSFPKNQQGTLSLLNGPDSEGLKLHFSTSSAAFFEIDRKNCGQTFATTYGTKRRVSLQNNAPIKLHILVDHSTCEVFINDGELVFSQRIFPNNNDLQIVLASESEVIYNGDWWKISNTIH
ncbi:sucrose-6-phosphate hydrolase [Lactobacillus sp. UCMA15818]|uniref:sucrose-6-phosphate hydrolase n=1 Tax=Lactobacillus sp. UCMA15818 TaxID=2583394 RepID=UPI0025B18520|nr:sucrose-6-phosphate hydrolase [Lactobacillus sp. UCMA15818]MDN2453988.1 sucrose-6-phosphate hydrolase [Lactobacillus sp. UCMA15818]